MSLNSKILAMLVLMSIIPMMIVGLYYDINTQKLIEKNTIAYSESTTRDLARLVDSRLETLARSVNSNIANRTLQDILASSSARGAEWSIQEELHMKNLFDSVVFLNPEVRSIGLYLYSGKIEVYGARDIYTKSTTLPTSMKSVIRSVIEKDPDARLSEKVKASGYQPIWLNSFIETNPRGLLVKEIKTRNYTIPAGLLIYYIDPQYIFNSDNDPMENLKATRHLVNENGIYLLHEDSSKLGSPMEPAVLARLKDSMKSSGKSTVSLVDEDRILTCTQLQNQWLLVNEIEKAPLFSSFTLYRNTTLLIALACIFIAIRVSMMFSGSISRRVNGLVLGMERVELGNMDIPMADYPKAKDQISLLYRHFNQMVRRLHALIQSEYVQKLKTRDAELKALQYQINPHFLYNTLEVINSSALRIGADHICEVTLRLAQILRYNLKSGLEPVPLDVELKHVENYVFLHKLTDSHSVELFYEIDPALKDCLVPRFIFQPLVENAILHGFKTLNRPGIIEIHIVSENDILIVRISDDGAGISPARLEELNQMLKEKTGSLNQDNTIGILNVSTRIRLTYGEAYGLSLESRESLGTSSIIRLPMQKEVSYVLDPNC